MLQCTLYVVTPVSGIRQLCSCSISCVCLDVNTRTQIHDNVYLFIIICLCYTTCISLLTHLSFSSTVELVVEPPEESSNGDQQTLCSWVSLPLSPSHPLPPTLSPSLSLSLSLHPLPLIFFLYIQSNSLLCICACFAGLHQPVRVLPLWPRTLFVATTSWTCQRAPAREALQQN